MGKEARSLRRRSFGALLAVAAGSFALLSAQQCVEAHQYHHHSHRYSGSASASGSTSAAENRPLPNRGFTPGAVLAVTNADICTRGYTKKVRNVPIAVKKEIYSEYHVAYVPHQDEVDHLIPLELGGSNATSNLWVQPYNDRSGFGAHQKDHLENRLRVMVCAGRIGLHQAQTEIATDWIAAYKKYIAPTPQGEHGEYEQ
jgi:hypothetical protein